MLFRYLAYFSISYLLSAFDNAGALLGYNVSLVMPNDYPFIVSIGVIPQNSWTRRHHLCCGSLITKKHVLTAAHCLNNTSYDELDVAIGESHLGTALYFYYVNNWITYDAWAQSRNISLEVSTNDIAILTLELTIDRPGVTPVVISPLNYKQLFNKNGMIAGWGDTRRRPEEILQKAKVKILSTEECEHKLKLITNQPRYGYDLGVGRAYLCDSAVPFVLTTDGDRGGPLLGKGNFLLGVAHSTYANADNWAVFSPEFISQYKVILHASVDHYRDFIENVSGLVTRPF